MQKFNESLMATLLYLLSSPETRPYVRSDVGLEVCCVVNYGYVLLTLDTFIVQVDYFDCSTMATVFFGCCQSSKQTS